MPGGDGTGPMGYGPMTGRAAGYCAGNNVPGYANAGFGRGLGRGAWGRGFGRGFGRGAGRGWRNRFYATGVPGWAAAPYAAPPYAAPYYGEPAGAQEERQWLASQANALKQQLDDIQARLDELDREKAQSEGE